jgi:hypothetical protein
MSPDVSDDEFEEEEFFRSRGGRQDLGRNATTGY